MLLYYEDPISSLGSVHVGMPNSVSYYIYICVCVCASHYIVDTVLDNENTHIVKTCFSLCLWVIHAKIKISDKATTHSRSCLLANQTQTHVTSSVHKTKSQMVWWPIADYYPGNIITFTNLLINQDSTKFHVDRYCIINTMQWQAVVEAASIHRPWHCTLTRRKLY